MYHNCRFKSKAQVTDNNSDLKTALECGMS